MSIKITKRYYYSIEMHLHYNIGVYLKQEPSIYYKFTDVIIFFSP